MNASIQETAILIEHYKVIDRETQIEGDHQQATIARVQKRYNQPTIEKLQRLIELEKLVPDLQKKIRELEMIVHGKAAHRAAETDAKTAV